MRDSKGNLPLDWDDVPEWTEEQFNRAELRIGDRVIRPATGTLTCAGLPLIGGAVTEEVTLWLDADVIAKFQAVGPGWQSQINTALRAAVGV